VLSALNQLKGALEHGGTIGHDPNPLLRSRSTLLPLRWLLMPFNISLHFEHHLNATVPWYSLPMYHRTVRALVPETERTRYFSRSALASLR
jgi:fatty acid desaturase